MKTLFFTLAMVIAGTITASAQENHKLTIIVSDIQIMKGDILVLVCDKDNFMKGSVKSGMASVKGNTATIEITDLPAGEYAVMLFHDENGNHQLDMGESGVPLEGFGFSGNATSIMGVPTFDDCRITVSGDSTITIRIQRF